MRVIGGNRKGAKLRAPRGLTTRPLLARIKKALFSVLEPRLLGARFLDLFAGTGSVGIEALSRGAASCVFVEYDMRCIDVIRENLQRLRLGQNAKAVRSEALKALRYLDRAGEQFDVVFVGPPYGRGLEHRTMELLARCNILAPHGVIIVQSRKPAPARAGGRTGGGEALLDTYSCLSLTQTRTYGDTSLWFYEHSPVGGIFDETVVSANKP